MNLSNEMRVHLYTVLVALLILLVFGCAHASWRRFWHAAAFYEPPHALRSIQPFVDVVRKEVRAYTSSWVPWPERSLYGKDDHWSIIPLFAFGSWSNEHVARFPETTRLLRTIPGLRTALFSRLGPGVELVPHQGWAHLSNQVLRCHWGVEVPNEPNACGVCVDNTVRFHRAGDWLVFDDSQIHYAFNRSKEHERIVLLVDIVRPWYVPFGHSTVRETHELQDLVDAVLAKNRVLS